MRNITMTLEQVRDVAKVIGFAPNWVDQYLVDTGRPWLREHIIQGMSEDDALWRDFLEELVSQVNKNGLHIVPLYSSPKEADDPQSAEHIGYYVTFAEMSALMQATHDDVARAAYNALRQAGMIR